MNGCAKFTAASGLLDGGEAAAERNRSLFRQRGTAGEFADGSVADVLQVCDADLAGVEAVAGETAQEVKEGDARAERGVLFGVFAEGDQVEDFLLLIGGAVKEDFAVAVGAEIVEPEEAAAKLQLILGIFASEKVDEFGSAGFDSATGFVVFGDDGVAERNESRILRSGEILWSVLSHRRRGFFAVDHLVDVGSGFGRNDLKDGTGDTNGESAENIATRDGFVRHGIHREEKNSTQRTQSRPREHREQKRREIPRLRRPTRSQERP